MSVFSDIDIRFAINQGHIICRPFVEENVRGSSIDLTLGSWYYQCGKEELTMGDVVKGLFDQTGLQGVGIYNPFDEDDVRRYFGKPLRARAAIESGIAGLPGIPPEHPIILIPGRTRILAHTHEFVGIHPPGTTEMRARSSWGRSGIAVCLCAGWGDPGFINRWTMEIHNLNDEAVPLPAGERVAQLIFHRTGDVGRHYGKGGKYQVGRDIEEIIKVWQPSDMLPRSYADERKMPAPL